MVRLMLVHVILCEIAFKISYPCNCHAFGLCGYRIAIIFSGPIIKNELGTLKIFIVIH